MPCENGTAVVMKFDNISCLEQHLYCLSLELLSNLFELVSVQLIDLESKKEQLQKKRNLVLESDSQRECQLQKDIESKKNFAWKVSNKNKKDLKIIMSQKEKRLLNENNSEKQNRLAKANNYKKEKRSAETDNQRQSRLESNRFSQRRSRQGRALAWTEISQQDYLKHFNNTECGSIEKQSWAKANINKFHKSLQYNICHCKVCHEA